MERARQVRRRVGMPLSATLAVLIAVLGPAVGVGSARSASRTLSMTHHLPLAATTGLDVMPFPGTPDASASSHVLFPTLKRSQVASITLTGSHSRRHTGRIVTLVDGRGLAFVPVQPFQAGERVSVTARLTSSAAAAAAGAPHTKRLRFSFTVARPVLNAYASRQASPDVALAPATPARTDSGASLQSFHSAPNLHPPVVIASGANPDTSSGDVFLTAQASPQMGPLILDAQGGVLWFSPVPAGQKAFDLRVQSYKGQRMLTYWQGNVVAGHGVGEDVIRNRSYQTVAVLHGAEGYQPDLHEFDVTGPGTALYTSFVPAFANLTSVGGASRGMVLDCIIQEVDIRTGQLLWEWHALGHVPVSASYAGRPWPGVPYDYFHLNSIQVLRNGNLLISARNTWGAYELNRRTGKLVWELGGKHSSFKQGAGTNFEWQHDARMQSNGTVTLFDDGASPRKESQSRAIRIALNTKTWRAWLARSYTNTPSVLAINQGNMQILPNGNVFVGWAPTSYTSEFTAAGRQIWSLKFPAPIQSYRSYRFPWSGQPAAPPAAAVDTSTGSTVVYASWNGATDVARWQLLAGPSPTQLAQVDEVARSGFETAIPTSSTQSYFAVRAVDAAGHVLSTSPAVTS